MSSLVNELQQAALDERVAVATLLRRALLVASKLEVKDFEEWARNELEGYQENEVPKYRHVRGTPMVWNPYHGWQHLNTDTAEFAEKISVMHMNTAIDAIEEQKHSKSGTYLISYNPQVEHMLMEGMELPLKPSLHVGEAAMRGILGRIRTIVLEWSIRLEKLGVVGENLTFSREEKSQAASVTIGTFIQGVTGSQIQLNSPGSSQQQGVTEAQLEKIWELIHLLDDDRPSMSPSDEEQELTAERETLKSQAQSSKPKVSILRESLKSVRGILEGAGGELLVANLPKAVELVTNLLSSM